MTERKKRGLPVPKESVTAQEYEIAFKTVKDFLQVDISSLHNLQDLSTAASGLGMSLVKIIQSQGQVYYEFSNKEAKAEHLIFSDVSSGLIVAAIRDNHVMFGKHDGEEKLGFKTSFPGFEANLPINQELIECTEPKIFQAKEYRPDNSKKEQFTRAVQEFSTMGDLDADIDMLVQAGLAQRFSPVETPDNEKGIQAFGRLTREFLSDLLEAIEPPAQIPESFRF